MRYGLAVRTVLVGLLLLFFASSPLHAEEQKTVETMRPYLWHGVGFLGAAGVLFVNGLIFNALADHSWDEYQKRADPDYIARRLSETTPDRYNALAAAEKAKADDYLREGKSYATTRTISYVAAGTFAVTGIILILITEEKVKEPPLLGFSLTPHGAAASLTLRF